MYPIHPKSSTEKFYSIFSEILHLTQSCVEFRNIFHYLYLSHHITTYPITTHYRITSHCMVWSHWSQYDKLWYNWADSAGLEQWLRSLRTAGGRSCPIHDPFWLGSISTLHLSKVVGDEAPHHDTTTTTNSVFYKSSTFLFTPGENYFQRKRDYTFLSSDNHSSIIKYFLW